MLKSSPLIPFVNEDEADHFFSAYRLRASVSSSSGPPITFERPPPPVDSPNARPAAAVGHQAPTTLEHLALTALTEVDTIRSTIDGLKSKLTGLETLLIAAFGELREDPAKAHEAERNLHAFHQQQPAPKAEAASPDMPVLPTPLPSRNSLPYGLSHLPPPHFSPIGDIFVHSQSRSRPPTASSASLSPFGSQHLLSASTAPSFTFPPPPRTDSVYDYPPFDPASSHLGALPRPPPTTTEAPPSSNLRASISTASVVEGRKDSDSGKDLREEEVAASLSLEFMALGRNRALNGTQASAQNPRVSPDTFNRSPLPPSLVFETSTYLPHPSTLFPDALSLSAVLPPEPETVAILEHAISHTGWYHGTVHGPTFRAEAQEFLAREGQEERVKQASPAWMALLFAQLCCGIKHMTREQLRMVGTHGLTEEEARTLAKTYLDAAIACLYRLHFLENHQLHAVQAIAVLVITSQDGAFSNLFPMLLSLGICIAQDMGLHRLPSEEAWAASVAGLPLEERARSLIAYETRKRVFWALTSQEWMSIPYRRTTAVQPLQVTTPLPSNAHDEDLMTGVPVNRPPLEYTVVSTLLIWIQIARILQQVFQHVDENPQPSHDFVFALDSQMQRLLDSVPPWLADDIPAPNLPPNASWMRLTWKISSNHKLVVLHRAFFRRFEESRRIALGASRTILREAAKVGESRMWTVPYHISAAASVVCLDLFQRDSAPSVLYEERHEILSALSTLRSLSSFSSIAARGAALIDNLLSEESRLPPIHFAYDHSPPASKKRKVTHETSNSLPQSPSPNLPPSLNGSGGPASLSNLLASPDDTPVLTPSGLVFSADSASASPNLPQDGFSASSFFGVDTSTSSSKARLRGSVAREGGVGPFGMGANGLGLVDDLPPSFMGAFLASGFDPLGGTVNSPAPGAEWNEAQG
ncbi:hypothetical protein JCM11641_000077 [Rhodosporidiobolus odoratus]